jgi:type IV secretory pathway TrbD component
MSNTPKLHPVYKSLNKPLTIWGAERRLFFLALVTGAAIFNFFGSLWSGLAIFVVLLFLGRRATAYDPQALRILLNSSRFQSRYDPLRRIAMKRESVQ